MVNFDAQLLDNMQASVQNICEKATKVQKEEVAAALSAAHDLLAKAKEAAHNEEMDNVKKFLASLANLTAQLQQKVRSFSPDNYVPEQYQSIYEQATGAYQEYIVPLLPVIQEQVENGKLPTSKTVWLAVAALGYQALSAGLEVIKFRNEMNPEEQLIALAGTVVMLAGVGLMIAAIANPQIGIPLVATLAIIMLGTKLCQKATFRLKNDEIKQSLEKTSQQIEETAIHCNFNREEAAALLKAQALTFSANAPGSTPTSDAGYEPSLVEKCTKQFKNFFGLN